MVSIFFQLNTRQNIISISTADESQCWLKVLYFIFSPGSLCISDVYRCESGRWLTLLFNIFYQFAFYKSRHLFYEEDLFIKFYLILITNTLVCGISGSMYSEDYESNNFDQYVTKDDTHLPEGGTTLETHTRQQVPASTPTAPTSNNRTMPRPCDKRVDLYILQPDRLNTSGQFNPLKGKLTNCHVTGCER